MAYTEPGEVALRAENVDRAIKNIAARKFVLKTNLVSIVNSNSWEESYYRESIRAMDSLDNIPRDAEFPSDTIELEKKTSRQGKFGLEAEVSWEDASTNRIDVISRALFRVGNRIANRVDKHIWDTVSEALTVSDIRTVAVAAGSTWDHVTRSNRIPHEDIAKGVRQIVDSDLQAYTPDTIVVNPYEYIYLVTNDYVMDSFDASGPSIMQNGNLGTLLGLKLLVTPTATTDYALLAQSKICATYKQVQPLRTVTIQDQGKKHTIRGWEIGVCQLTDPKAVCLITNTKT